ncbi:MAG: MoaD/ThiS family protein [Promethearchaeota archaeon]
MGLKIKLYGDLREKVLYQKSDNGLPSTINIEKNEIKTVLDILNNYNITQDEISHIFVNSKYSGAGKEVKNGDRIGIFPKKMGLIFVEIPLANSFRVVIKLSSELARFGPNEANLTVPEGTTLNSVVNNYNFKKELGKLNISVNGKRCFEKNYILKNKDVVSIFP